MLDLAIIVLASLLSAIHLVALGRILYGIQRVPTLVSTDVTSGASLSVMIPACDEEEQIRATLEGLTNLPYAALQVVAINDRSSDATGAIMDQVAQADARVTSVHVNALPSGWLGKLNALQQGVTHATGDWLLFMDADVALAPNALTTAIAHAERDELDLLAVMPKLLPMGLAADAVFCAATTALLAGGRLWQMADPGSDAVAASGAFILVRRRAFAETPGFEWLKLEVADDFGLALMMKRHGKRCGFANGADLVSLQWYSSFAELRDRMQKNFYGIMARFSLARALTLGVMMAGYALFPLTIALPGLSWAARGLVGLSVVLVVAANLLAARWARRPRLPALLPHLGHLASAYLLVRSGIIGHRLGGIQWRGMVYRSEALKSAQRVRL